MSFRISREETQSDSKCILREFWVLAGELTDLIVRPSVNLAVFGGLYASHIVGRMFEQCGDPKYIARNEPPQYQFFSLLGKQVISGTS